MDLPNFLIVGAAKSGTTSLYNYLGQHPDIFFPEVKEPHYFSDSNTYMARNLAEYQGLFAKNKGEKRMGEASVSYLYDPTSPGKIWQTLGEIKIIASLRNPVNRAYSHWQHFYNVGWEDLPFREALGAEDERFHSLMFRQNAPALVPSGYFYYRRGLYADQVNRYLMRFGAQNLKVLIFERWVQDVPGTCRELFEFLGVDPAFQPDLAVVNPAHRTRHQGLHDLLVTHRPKWITTLYQNAPLWLRDLIYRTGKRIYWANMTEVEKQPMADDLRQALLERFLPDIHRLEDLLQMDLSIWYAS